MLNVCLISQHVVILIYSAGLKGYVYCHVLWHRLKLIWFLTFPAVKGNRLYIVQTTMDISSVTVVYTSIELILNEINYLTDYQPTTNCFAYQFSNSQYL